MYAEDKQEILNNWIELVKLRHKKYAKIASHTYVEHLELFDSNVICGSSWALASRPKWRCSSRSSNHLVSVRLSVFQSYCLGRYMDLGFANSITGNRIEDAFVESL